MTVYNYACNDTVVNCWLQNDPAEGPAHTHIYLYTIYRTYLSSKAPYAVLTDGTVGTLG